MPNTPARLGKGMTVWYATPEHDRRAARAGGGAPRRPRRPDRGRRREDRRDGDRRQRHRPDLRVPRHGGAHRRGRPPRLPAPRRPRPRRRDARGQHALRQAVGDAPGRAPEHGHLARRDVSAAALHELESGRLRTVLSEAVWAAFRRTVELGDQLEASVGRRPPRRGDGPRPTPAAGPLVAVAPAPRVDLRRAPLADIRAIDFRAPSRDFWADEAAVCGSARWPSGPASTTPPGACPGAAPSDAGGPDWSLLDHVAHVVDWLEIGHRLRRAGARRRASGRPTTTSTAATSTRSTRAAGRASRTSRPPSCGRRRSVARERRRRVARRLPIETIRSDAAWGWVYHVLHGHDARPPPGPRAVGRPAPRPPGRERPVRPGPAPTRRLDLAARERPLLGRRGVRSTAPSTRRSSALPDRGVDRGPTTTPGWTLADHVGPPRGLVRRGRGRARGRIDRGEAWRPMPPEGVDAWNDRGRGARRGTPPEALRAASTPAATRLDAGRPGDARRRLARSGGLQLGLRGPPRPRPGPPRDDRPVVRPASAGRRRTARTGCTPTRRTTDDASGRAPGATAKSGGARWPSRRPAALTIEQHRRGRPAARVPRSTRATGSSPTPQEVAGARQLVHPAAPRRHRRPRSPRRRRTSSDPQWSPDGRRLAYVRDDEIRIVDADGSRDVVVAEPSGRRLAPALVARRPAARVRLAPPRLVPGLASSTRRSPAAAGRPATRSRRSRAPLTATGVDVEDLVWSADGRIDRDPAVPGAGLRRSARSTSSTSRAATETMGRRRRRSEWAAGPRRCPDGGLLYISDADGWFQVVRLAADARERDGPDERAAGARRAVGGTGLAPLPSPDGARFVHVDVHDALVDLVVAPIERCTPRQARPRPPAEEPRRRSSPRPTARSSTRGRASGGRSAGRRTARGSRRSARARRGRRTCGCCRCRASRRPAPGRAR